MGARFRRRGLLLFVFLLILGVTIYSLFRSAVSPPKEPVRVAFQVCNSLEENRARFTPLWKFLEKNLGRKVIVSHVNTFDFLDRAREKEFDFIQSNSYIYVAVKAELGATLVAREVKKDTGKDTGGLIVVKADSPIENLSDLKGKKLVFGPVLSPGGYLAQYYMMLTGGLDPESDLSGYYFLKGSHKHEKAIYSIFFGAYDAGAVKYGDLELMEGEGKINRADFRVISKSPPLPNCTFYALPHVGEELVELVRGALTSMKKNDSVEVDGEVLNVLYRDGISGYVSAEDSEFDIIREMARRVGMPPYEKY